MTPAFIAGLGPLELAIILLIVLVIVGGKRLPQLGRQFGGGVKEFKDSVTSRAESGSRSVASSVAPPEAGSSQRTIQS